MLSNEEHHQTTIIKLFANYNIKLNPESHAFFHYCHSNIDWLQNEVIMISFIDKMVSVNYEYYKTIITQLHTMLKYSIRQELQYRAISEHDDFKYTENYMRWILTTTTNDLLTTGLKPRFDDNEFMYILFYENFYSLGLWSQDTCYPLHIVIINNIFDNNMFNLLYSELNINFQQQSEETTNKKRHLDDNGLSVNKKMRRM